MSKALYFTFPRLHLVEFNTNAGAYVMGVPQPTAIGGFAHALARRICEALETTPAQLPAFAYAVSRFSGFSGISLNQRQASGTPRAELSTPAPIADRPRANLDFSLVVELVVEDSCEPLASALLADMVQAQKLQAGSLFCRAEPEVHNNFAGALAALPNAAFLLCDATDEFQFLLNDGQSVVAAMTSLIARPTVNAYKPRYVPVVTGWEGLESLVERKGMRAGASGHAFSEPVLSVGLFRGVGAARKLYAADSQASQLLWSHASDGSLYQVRGVPTYQEDIEY
jgi:hypothetical protein